MEWHPVNVTIQQLVQASLASRHDVEKERLLFVMSRQHGTWSPNHPRYRLLDALHGFSKYDERQRAGVDRLRDLYALMPRAQKKVFTVSLPLHLPLVIFTHTHINLWIYILFTCIALP